MKFKVGDKVGVIKMLMDNGEPYEKQTSLNKYKQTVGIVSEIREHSKIPIILKDIDVEFRVEELKLLSREE